MRGPHQKTDHLSGSVPSRPINSTNEKGNSNKTYADMVTTNTACTSNKSRRGSSVNSQAPTVDELAKPTHETAPKGNKCSRRRDRKKGRVKNHTTPLGSTDRAKSNSRTPAFIVAKSIENADPASLKADLCLQIKAKMKTVRIYSFRPTRAGDLLGRTTDPKTVGVLRSLGLKEATLAKPKAIIADVSVL